MIAKCELLRRNTHQSYYHVIPETRNFSCYTDRQRNRFHLISRSKFVKNGLWNDVYVDYFAAVIFNCAWLIAIDSVWWHEAQRPSPNEFEIFTTWVNTELLRVNFELHSCIFLRTFSSLPIVWSYTNTEFHCDAHNKWIRLIV